jgi:hypothetical protein
MVTQAAHSMRHDAKQIWISYGYYAESDFDPELIWRAIVSIS